MQKIKAIIIDDEKGNIITLNEMLINYCPEVIIAGTATNILEGEKLIHSEEPHLVFLDIEMPFGNGFELLNRLTPINFEVIFITAFNTYAVQAFKYSAMDYILKPVNISELKSAVNKAALKITQSNINLRLDSLLNNLKTEKQGQKKIGISSEEGILFEEIDNIMYLIAHGNYTAIYLKGGRKEMSSKSLKEYEDLLPESIFCRVHNSNLINLNYIKKYHKGRGGYIEMDDSTLIEVAQRRKDEFLAKLNV